MTRTTFSGIQPSGRLTLGNYLGALRRFVHAQSEVETTLLFSIVDLHALTVPHDPDRLRELTRETATLHLAAGLDPQRCVLFRQSAVPAHTELSYLLECTAHVGELSRMIQYKEKGRGRPRTRSSLLTYPVLMAADILVYGTTEVPVGDDQTQHVELARTLAARFNHAYGDVFVVPTMAPAEAAARVRDLQDPTRKMSKDSPEGALGAVRLLDPPEVVRRKLMRAVTDAGPDVVYDPLERPGVANLLQILGAAVGRDPAGLATEYDSYGALKQDVADAVIGLLAPIRYRYSALAADPGAVDAVLTEGAARAAELAAPTLTAARQAIGIEASASP